MHVDMKDVLMVLVAWPHHSGTGAMLDPPWRGFLQFVWGSGVDSHSPCRWARAFLRTCVVFTELIPPTPALFYFQYHLLVFKSLMGVVGNYYDPSILIFIQFTPMGI